MIYLDHNATAPPLPEAGLAMREAFEHDWANPSSSHGPGQQARHRLGHARAQVAALLGCAPAEVVFTSGATESNHAALRGARGRIVISAAEHASVLALAQRLRDSGRQVDVIGVDRDGGLDLDAAARLIGPDVGLVSVIAAQHETGVLMPIAELGALCRGAGVALHVDATQLVGRSELRFDASGADLWSVSAHKLGGPKGVGALLVRRGLDWPALFDGSQERGRRGGTENLAGCAGFGAAAASVGAGLGAAIARMRGLRERFESGLRARIPALHVHGAAAPRLPNTTLLRCGEIDADPILNALERAGVVAASGAACGAGARRPSAALLAMGETPRLARCALRFSLGRDTTPAEIDTAVDALAGVVAALHALDFAGA